MTTAKRPSRSNKPVAAKVEPEPTPARKPAASGPSLITATNLVGFPIGGATPDALRDRVGSAVEGCPGYFVRYPYASYDLARKVGEVEGPEWLAVCRHGKAEGAAQLMGPEGVEKVAAARKTWCPSAPRGPLAANRPSPAASKPAPYTENPAPAKRARTSRKAVAK